MPKLPAPITAQQARFKFMDDDFVQSMIAVTEAILAAAPDTHTVSLDIPTGQRDGKMYSIAYHVCKRLQEQGFNVNIIHDPENGSSELTIDWFNGGLS